MKATYSEDMKTAFFDGHKFRRDMKTGYYLATVPTCNGKRERLHVYVWRYFNGPIKDGYHIHHKDENKEHNDVENLECIPRVDHLSLHAQENAIENHDFLVRNLAENAIPKAAEWHGSAIGHEWHKKHYEEMKAKLYVKHDFVCEHCGKRFTSTQSNSRFCSNNCKSVARKKSGVDDETRICAFCGKEFTINRYAKSKCCSRSCARNLQETEKRKTSRQTARV